jgi:hypothetical protein
VNRNASVMCLSFIDQKMEMVDWWWTDYMPKRLPT